MPPLRVLVTRPARDAEHWVQQLQLGGVAAEALPLIEIAPASGAASVQALAEAWQTLARGHYAACLFVSGNAVDYFFRQKERLAHVEHAQGAIENIAITVPPGLRFMAPGPGTVAALIAVGVPAGQIDAPAADALQFGPVARQGCGRWWARATGRAGACWWCGDKMQARTAMRPRRDVTGSPVSGRPLVRRLTLSASTSAVRRS